jgi:hypothetical protein
VCGLEVTQRAFFDLVSARGELEDVLEARGMKPRDVAGLVRGDARASAAERVGVYADMYHLRLRDSLAEDFERLAALLGAEAFDHLVAQYLEAHPPRSPYLAELGGDLPRFVRARRLGRERPWLGDLADLEWARTRVFDAADEPALALADLAALAPEAFDRLALRLVPASVVLDVAFDVADTWERLGAADADPVPAAAAVPRRILVWRRDDVVLHQTLTAEQAELLSIVGASGVTFGELCGRLGEGRSPEAAARAVWEALAPIIGAGALAAP